MRTGHHRRAMILGHPPPAFPALTVSLYAKKQPPLGFSAKPALRLDSPGGSILGGISSLGLTGKRVIDGMQHRDEGSKDPRT